MDFVHLKVFSKFGYFLLYMQYLLDDTVQFIIQLVF